MKILGIETATEICSAGIADCDVIVGEQWINRRRAHAERLPGMIDRLLADTGVTPDELDGIAVSIGPGSFTGLRVGLSAAKGYAAAWQIPVIPVETLAALAQPVLQRGRRIIAGVGTRNRLLYAATYRWSQKGPKREGEIYFGEPGKLPAAAHDVLCIGPAGDDVWRRFCRRSKQQAAEALAWLHRPSGAAVALVGSQIGPAETADSWKTLEPLYMQGFPARPPRRS
jgi:tRNA threonylcarbamoyladenosine biosynthesis protein TsaB